MSPENLESPLALSSFILYQAPFAARLSCACLSVYHHRPAMIERPSL